MRHDLLPFPYWCPPTIFFLFFFFCPTGSTTEDNFVQILLHSNVNISVEHVSRSITYIAFSFYHIPPHRKSNQAVLLPAMSDSTLSPLPLATLEVLLPVPLPLLPLCPSSSTASLFSLPPPTFPSHSYIPFTLLHLSLTCVIWLGFFHFFFFF